MINDSTNELIDNLQKYDQLTGLMNRQYFFKCVHNLLQKNPEEKYVILYIDIDNFSVYNDMFGISEGDTLLCSFARIIKECLGENIVASHFYADHFVIFALEKEATTFFPMFTKALNQKLNNDSHDFEFVPRVGVYFIDDRSVKVDVMCERALLALKETKKDFSSCSYACYEEKMRNDVLKEQSLVTDMASALANKQFEVYFQPQYNYVDGAVTGAEALVRWNHPTKGMISPNDFIPIFEKNGFIYRLDKYIWERVCINIRKWLDNPDKYVTVPVSVNVSRVDTYKDNLCQYICDLVDRYSVPRKYFHLEITESAYMNQPQKLIELVDAFRKEGFEVHMDDFGSGYSSLNTLKNIPIDLLKLDMKFIEIDNQAEKGGIILNSVIRMAQLLNVPVLAEGVETVEQAEHLKSIGCKYMQGYYFSKPVPLTKFEQLIKAKSVEETSGVISHNAYNMIRFVNPASQEAMLFNGFVGSAIILEYHNGVVKALRVNNQYFKEIGISYDEFDKYRNNLLNRFPENSRKRLLEIFDEAVRTNEEQSFEITVNNASKPGELLWEHNRVRFLAQVEERKFLFLTVDNITEKKKLQEKILYQKNYLEMMYQTVPCGIIYHSTTETINGYPKAISVNKACCRIAGIDDEAECLAYINNAIESMTGESKVKEETISQIKKLTDGKTYDFRQHIINANGECCWIIGQARYVDTSNDSRCLQSVFMNITKQELLESEMEADSYATVLAHTVDEVTEIDFENETASLLTSNKYPDTKKRTVIPLDVSKELWLAKISSEFVSEASRFITEENIIYEAKRGILTPSFRYKCILDDGSTEWYNLTLVRMSDRKYLSCTKNITPLVIAHEMDEKYKNLKSQAEQNSELLTQIPVGIGIYEYENGKLFNVFYNKSLGQTLHYNNEECRRILADDPFIPVMAEDKQIVIDSINEAVNGKTNLECIVRMYDKAKNIVWIRICTTAIKNSVGKITLYCAFIDITEQKEKEERLNSLNNAIPGGVCVLDVNPEMKNAEVIYSNKYFENSGVYFIGHNKYINFEDMRARIYSDDREKSYENFKAMLQNLKPFSMRYREITHDGRPYWLHSSFSVKKHSDTKYRVRVVTLDINEQMKQSDEYDRILMAVAKQNKIAIWIYDIATRTIKFNKSTDGSADFAGIYGDVPEYFFENNAVHPDDKQIAEQMFSNIINGCEHEDYIYRWFNPQQGTYRWVKTAFSNIYENGVVVKGIGSTIDITKQIIEKRSLTQQANCDRMTNLLNRVAFFEMAKELLNNAVVGKLFVFGLFDIDNFKRVNDTLGHRKGDYVIETIGKVFTENKRETDLIGRLGGDEFMVFAPVADITGATVFATRLHDVVTNTLIEKCDITISMGISIFPDHGKKIEDLYLNADIALYEAKHRGKNNLVVYDDSIVNDEDK